MATHTERTAAVPDVEPLVANLGWLLSQASHALTTELTAGLEGMGISPRAYCVLTSAMTGDRTQTELARMVGIDKTTMVVTLDELETAGLAERRPAAGDRRVRVVGVTPAGRAKVNEAEEVARRIQTDVLDALPARERAALMSALVRLVSGRLSKPAACTRPVRRRA